MNSFEQKARIFAMAAHTAIGQKRKYTGEPYIVHPKEVVDILKYHFTLSKQHLSDETIAAAWLHDVIEDTQVELDTIQQEFGDQVALFVNLLSEPPKIEGENRKQRKRKFANILAASPREVQNIKIADLMSNAQNIVERKPDFAPVYLNEKLELLEKLQNSNKFLWIKAQELVLDQQSKIVCNKNTQRKKKKSK